MEEIRERLDSARASPKTAAKVREALDGGVGDDLARLNFAPASQALDAITRLDKKIDDLGARIDCSSATPEAMAVAIMARAAERVLSIWRCRPENIVTGEVRTPFLSLFSSQGFPASKTFLDQLAKGELNVLKEIKPSGPLRFYGPNVLSLYLYLPLGRALVDGNAEAVESIAANAPPGYWNDYPFLMEDLTGLMRLPDSGISTATVIRIISQLRQAGVQVESHDYKAFRDAYRGWLVTELPDDLRAPMAPPNQIEKMMARQMGYSLSPRPLRPSEHDLWKMVSDALAPSSADALRKARFEAITDLTENDLQATSKTIQEVTEQLSGHKWWRKLPETTANLDEAARRQAVNAFDNFGYVPVAPGELRDDDVARNQYYPNCDCVTVKDLRDRLAKASQRRDSILRFRSTLAN